MADGFALMGRDMFGDVVLQKKNGPIGERFEFAPFSALDARAGDWLERKRSWLSVGIQSEVGRSAKTFNIHEWTGADPRAAGQGTSIFDPVLCEMMYRWFVPPGGQIIDPFAGGSVRGIVASLLGFDYWGCDLRDEQIAANEEQADEICKGELRPHWVRGDALDALDDAPLADFIFSCPPYGDLEVYSDDPRDLSTMEYHTFVAAYGRIILRALRRLKNNRFACFVVGDFRDKRTGHYRGFVADTVNLFREQGAALYNDAVLVQPVGSLPIRVTKQFDATRKLGKTHQNVLLFVKGDARKATAEINA